MRSSRRWSAASGRPLLGLRILCRVRSRTATVSPPVEVGPAHGYMHMGSALIAMFKIAILEALHPSLHLARLATHYFDQSLN